LHLAGEVIATGARISRAKDRTSRDFPFEVDMILQRIRELRMVSRIEDVKRLCEKSILRVEKAGKNKGIHAEEGREKPINTKQESGQLIAKDAGSAPYYCLAVAEDVPGEAELWGQKIHRCPGEYLTDGWRGIRRWVANSREAPVRLGRIGVEVVPQPN